jgi:ABC-type Zn uptake system ZnuABC Zn-binding protein ZnuA
VVTPDDMRRLEQADALIVNGLGLDDFARATFERVRPGRSVIAAAESLNGLIPHRGPHVEHAGQEPANQYNPHLFASPRRAARMVSALVAGLERVDPEGRQTYEENGRRLSADLDRLAGDIQATAAQLNNRAIITQHDVFDYFAQDAGLKIVAVIAVHPGEGPSAAEVLRIIAAARSSRAGAVFTEPQYPPSLGRTIAQEAGIPYATLDPVATGPEDAGRDYYERTMRANLDALVRVLGGGR